ncbi:MAG: GNAT family N-acetyltransferase [Phycisphaeraceae bacterium]|nr:GNAT family N-acetyltransferase [Phycisphaerales bacterium]MCB9860936.1 GNAT family N-acetyltransferase [Phycisphaeraceae bacterium]
MTVPMMKTVNLDTDELQGKYAESVASWLLDAEEPFSSWLHEGRENAQTFVNKLMNQRASLRWLGRVTVGLQESTPIGGFIGISGKQMQLCATSDALAFIRAVPREQHAERSNRFRDAYATFPSVPSATYLLSHFGITPSVRGKGLSTPLLKAFLLRGAQLGFTMFQLNVACENEPAIRLYSSHGFKVDHTFSIPKTSMQFHCMRLAC